MVLTGKEAEAFMAEIAERNARSQAEALSRAKAAAALAGKEPFDLDRLEQLVDTSSEGRIDAREERYARYERMYYVERPSILTLEAFARAVAELNSW